MTEHSSKAGVIPIVDLSAANLKGQGRGKLKGREQNPQAQAEVAALLGVHRPGKPKRDGVVEQAPAIDFPQFKQGIALHGRESGLPQAEAITFTS